MAIFFTADTYFGDHHTLNIWRRPFASVTEMDALLVDRWNVAVGVDDEVWHLGDFARRGDDAPAFLDRLHGRKHLVGGNNDPDGTVANEGWTSVADYAEINLDRVKLVLCHYPIRR